MPALTDTNAVILVTGANGFLGAWIAKMLLERGYAVRAAVRSGTKGQHLLTSNKAYGDKLQLAVVGDIAKLGAFDQAVKGVDGIIHTASPVTVEVDEPRDLIEPAINGAVGLLESASRNGSSVKRIVITSSFAAVGGYSNETITVTEDLWNEASIKDVEINGRNAHQLSKYAASKTLAEKAVWEYFKKRKFLVNWDITVLNPPWIFGPVVHEVGTLKTLNSSCMYFYQALVKGDFFLGEDPLNSPGRGWADVRDVAEAHIRALEIPAAGGERILVSNESFVWKDLLDIANSMSPKPYHTLAQAPSGTPVRNTTININTEKEHRILGLKYRSIEELIKDTFEDYARRGW